MEHVAPQRVEKAASPPDILRLRRPAPHRFAAANRSSRDEIKVSAGAWGAASASPETSVSVSVWEWP